MQSSPEAGSLCLSGYSDAILSVPYAESVYIDNSSHERCGDALLAPDRLMARAGADLVFTDPPYDFDYEDHYAQKTNSADAS